MLANSPKLFRTPSGVEVNVLIEQRVSALPRRRCLLLHGNPGSIRDWSELTFRLAPMTDLVVIDLPGFGSSPLPKNAGALSLNGLADVATEVCRSVGWSSWVTVGHSHGGAVAQLCAARHSETVEALALIGSLGTPMHTSYRLLSMPGMGWMMRLVGLSFRSTGLRPMQRWILRQIMNDIYHPHRVDRDDLEDQLSSIAEHPSILQAMVAVTRDNPCALLEASATRIRCPTLFMHGAQDRLVPIAHARTLHQRLVDSGGNSHFESVPDAGHMLHRFGAQLVADRVASLLGAAQATTATPLGLAGGG